MIPIWGRAGTVDFINNTGRDIRGTMYIQVDPNLTVTDYIIRDTVSDYTRYGMRLQNQPYNGQLSLIVSIHNYTLNDVIGYGHKAMAACNGLGSCSNEFPRAGGVAIEGLRIRNASTAYLVLYNNRGHDPAPGAPVPVFNASFNGTGLAVYALKNFSFEDSQVGARIDDSVAEGTFAGGSIEGCGVRVNCSQRAKGCVPFVQSLLAPPPPSV